MKGVPGAISEGILGGIRTGIPERAKSLLPNSLIYTFLGPIPGGGGMGQWLYTSIFTPLVHAVDTVFRQN